VRPGCEGGAGMSAMSVKERQDKLKAERAAEGLKEIRSLYANAEDFKKIRDYVARLNAKRRHRRTVSENC